MGHEESGHSLEIGCEVCKGNVTIVSILKISQNGIQSYPEIRVACSANRKNDMSLAEFQ